MKFYTIKDLLKYNNPCKSCQNNTFFCFKVYSSDSGPWNESYIKPSVKDGLLSFIISVTYKGSLVLTLNPINNKFTVSYNEIQDINKFKKFIKNNSINIEIQCKNCKTLIESGPLEFNEDVVKPISLLNENICITSDTHIFIMSTSYSVNKTFIFANTLEVDNSEHLSNESFTREFPIMPLSNFKNRDSLLQKMKLILIFN